jgi:PAS domain S-box-containing protein
VAIAAASILGTLIVAPAMTNQFDPGIETVVALVYPLLDLGVLAVMIWLLFGSVRLNTVLALLTAAFTFYLAADLLYEYRLVNGLTDRTWVWREAMYLAAVILIVAAATAPGADRIAHPTSATMRRATPIRLVALVAAVLTVPALLAFAVWSGRDGSAKLLAIASVLVIGLGLWRTRILLTTIEQQQRLNELVLDSAGDGIIGLAPDGTVVFVNMAARRILRCREEDVVERNFHDVAHHQHPDGTPYPWSDCPTRELIAQGKSGALTNSTYIRRDGVHIPVDVIITPMLAGDVVAGAVMLFRDISERAAIEEMKSQFIAIISHELRTPLTSIKGSLQLLDAGVVGPVTGEQQQLLTMAVNNTDRLRKLVDDILDVERLDAGRMPLRPEPVNALSLAHQAIEGIEGAAQSAGIAVRVQSPSPESTLVVDVDPHRMLQVLANLLGNAIKFSERDSTVSVDVSRAGPSVTIAVADHGRGIPADRLASVFERFGQVESGDARRQGGTGLGLAIAKELVTRSGGTLDVTSTVGVGSTFTVTLPARPGGPAEEPTDLRPPTEG